MVGLASAQSRNIQLRTSPKQTVPIAVHVMSNFVPYRCGLSSMNMHVGFRLDVAGKTPSSKENWLGKVQPDRKRDCWPELPHQPGERIKWRFRRMNAKVSCRIIRHRLVTGESTRHWTEHPCHKSRDHCRVSCVSYFGSARCRRSIFQEWPLHSSSRSLESWSLWRALTSSCTGLVSIAIRIQSALGTK